MTTLATSQSAVFAEATTLLGEIRAAQAGAQGDLLDAISQVESVEREIVRSVRDAKTARKTLRKVAQNDLLRVLADTFGMEIAERIQDAAGTSLRLIRTANNVGKDLRKLRRDLERDSSILARIQVPRRIRDCGDFTALSTSLDDTAALIKSVQRRTRTALAFLTRVQQWRPVLLSDLREALWLASTGRSVLDQVVRQKDNFVTMMWLLGGAVWGWRVAEVKKNAWKQMGRAQKRGAVMYALISKQSVLAQAEAGMQEAVDTVTGFYRNLPNIRTRIRRVEQEMRRTRSRIVSVSFPPVCQSSRYTTNFGGVSTEQMGASRGALLAGGLILGIGAFLWYQDNKT